MQIDAVVRRLRAQYRLRRPPSPAPGQVTAPPDFVGVGTQRSGTTWWYDLVVAHPAVHAGHDKELHYFHRYSQRTFTERDAQRYAEYFPRPAGLLAGEWSPGYMAHYWAPACLRRAAPDTRVLVILRDPVERYVSGVALQGETRRASAASASAAFRLGCYGSQLAHLRAWFPPHQVLVLQLERCVKDPASEIRRTYEFLGVDAAYVPADLVGTRNAGRGRKPVLDDDHRRWLVRGYEEEVERARELVPELDVALWPNFAHLS